MIISVLCSSDPATLTDAYTLDDLALKPLKPLVAQILASSILPLLNVLALERAKNDYEQDLCFYC